MPNIEIKAVYPNLEKARKISERLQARLLGRDHQIDTYFRTRAGRFKLRESSLSGTTLIPYLRPDQSGPKKSDYALLSVEDAGLVKRLLGEVLGVERVVDKQREIFLLDNVRVHLDEVKDLGSFLEFEAVYKDDSPAAAAREREKVNRLLKEYEIASRDLIEGSYGEMRTVPGYSSP